MTKNRFWTFRGLSAVWPLSNPEFYPDVFRNGVFWLLRRYLDDASDIHGFSYGKVLDFLVDQSAPIPVERLPVFQDL
jgi:hypothetical protein